MLLISYIYIYIYIYIYNISSLRVNLDARGGGWSRHGRFNPGKVTRYPLYRRLGGHRFGLNGRGKLDPPSGFDLRTVQPVEIRYTDYTAPVGGEIFHTPPDLPWGPPSLLYNGHRAPYKCGRVLAITTHLI